MTGIETGASAQIRRIAEVALGACAAELFRMRLLEAGNQAEPQADVGMFRVADTRRFSVQSQLL